MKEQEHQVFVYKTDAMKSLQSLVAKSGYSRYTTDVIDTGKLEKLIYRFEDRYDIHANKQKRYRQKKDGLCNSKLVLLKENKYQVRFWLLVTPGSGVIEDLENLVGVTDKKNRLELTGYELVRIQKNDAVRWTWRITKNNYEEWQQRIQNACRHKSDEQVRQIIYSLQKMPVFSEMRLQAYALFRELQAQYRRYFTNDLEEKLFKAFYGRFKAAETVNAIQLSRKVRRYHPRQREIDALKREMKLLDDQFHQNYDPRNQDLMLEHQIQMSGFDYQIQLLKAMR